jgi:hypothetical protein
LPQFNSAIWMREMLRHLGLLIEHNGWESDEIHLVCRSRQNAHLYKHIAQICPSVSSTISQVPSSQKVASLPRTPSFHSSIHAAFERQNSPQSWGNPEYRNAAALGYAFQRSISSPHYPENNRGMSRKSEITSQSGEWTTNAKTATSRLHPGYND